MLVCAYVYMHAFLWFLLLLTSLKIPVNVPKKGM